MGMHPIYRAVLANGSSKEINLCKAWFQFHNLPFQEVQTKSWKQTETDLYLFVHPNPGLVDELREWSIEPILLGSFPKEEVAEYQKKGVSLHWDRDFTLISSLPIFPIPGDGYQWLLYTKDQTLDRKLQVFLRAMGQQVFLETDEKTLLKRLALGNIQFTIIHWDNVGFESLIQSLRVTHSKYPFLSIGIRNPNRDNLYRDLKQGLNQVSNVLLAEEELFPCLWNSFPLVERNQSLNQKQSLVKKKLVLDFQERSKPIGLRLVEERKEFVVPKIDAYENLLECFRILLP